MPSPLGIRTESKYRYHRYVCSTYTRKGANNKAGCRHYAIRQELIYDVIIGKLRAELLVGGSMDRLKNCLRRRLQQRLQPDTKQVEQLKRRLKELDKQLDRFAKQWFEAPEALLSTLTAEAEAKKREREMVFAQLKQAKAAAEPIDVDAEIEKAAGKVWRLAEELNEAEPARLRELISWWNG